MLNTKFVINAIEREKDIVNMVWKNINFLKTHKIRFTLPEKTIEEDYSIKKYEMYKKWIESEWRKKEKGFTKQLLTFFHRPVELQFTIEISNYGPLGFYNANNNSITINFNTHLDPINTIKHEMTHIMLEPFINKYRINHSQKELIVNTILKILEPE